MAVKGWFQAMSPEQQAITRQKMAESKRNAWKNRDTNKLGTRINGALQSDVQARISESVKQAWADGDYTNRINGMTGKRGSEVATWTWGKTTYRAILTQFEPIVCVFCGRGVDETKIDTHHVDEDHNNYLLSNLMWVCVPCHLHEFHYKSTNRKRQLTPFVTISKRFSFEYSHILPWHPGKCAQLHGHSGHLEVTIRGRINTLGVVQDFYDISQAVKLAVIDELDHRFLNDWLSNPTSEELLPFIWERLEHVGLKGLNQITFSETDTSSATITAHDMFESFGWDQTEDGIFHFVPLERETNEEICE